MSTAASDILFLSIFHNLPGISAGKEIKYYAPADGAAFRTDLRTAVEHYFTLFAESFDYAEYFSCADYSITEDCFDEAEIELFRSALEGNDRTVSLGDLHPSDTFNGCRAVIAARVSRPDLATNRQGIQLFNFLMECALPADDRRNPQCAIRLETAREFGPRFVRELLDIIPENTVTRRHLQQDYGPFEALRRLRPMLQIVEATVDDPAWPQSDSALGKFLLVVDYYQELERSKSGMPES